MTVAPIRLTLMAALALVLAGAPLAEEPSSDGVPLDLASVAPAQRFDFLLGSWSYRFAQGSGRTTYAAVPGGTAVREIFGPGFLQGQEFHGASLFLFDAESGDWTHNWIDTLGNSLHGTGGLRDDEVSELPVMLMEFEHLGRRFRHLWYDIRAERFETDLLVSGDAGESWQLVRRMAFELEGGDASDDDGEASAQR